MTDEQLALEQIKKVYEDNEAEINGRKYKFTKTVHKKRLSVFAYFTKIQYQLNSGDLSFLDTAEFERISDIIANTVTFEDSLLSRLTNHWEEHEQDFVILMTTAMAVLSYPFLGESRTR